jgi:hypothetical protein
MGAILELPSAEWFGDFNENLTVHVIDSGRPQNLSSLFGGEPEADRVVIWDDGGADDLEEEKKAWEALMVCALSIGEDTCSCESSMSLSLIPTQTQKTTQKKTSQKTQKRRKRKAKAARRVNDGTGYANFTTSRMFVLCHQLTLGIVFRTRWHWW